MKKYEYTVDLPGSVNRYCGIDCACLEVWKGQAELRVHRGSEIASLRCGALRFRRK